MLKRFAAYQLAIRFYRACELVRANRNLKDQLTRASSSIALNLAEGSERGSPADQRRFYRMAMGSVRECQAVLDLIGTGGEDAAKIGDEVAATVFSLCRAIDRKLTSPQLQQGTGNRGPRTDN